MPAPGSTNYDFPCIAAEYNPHPLARFRSNPLISAINSFYPQTLQALLKELNVFPDFTQKLRLEDPMLRRLALGELLRFRVATPALKTTVANIHSYMLESYVGREPYSVLSARRLEELNQHFKHGTFPQLGETGAQFSSAIFGMPGCGKTFAIEAAESLYLCRGAPVIHHEKYGIWQIPVLKLKMPFLGMSRISLATAIIKAVAESFPPGDYERIYLRSRLNSNQLMLQAFSLLHIHKVGYVLVDEGQGDVKDALAGGMGGGTSGDTAAEKVDKTALTTLIVAGSNQAGTPLMLIGTPELEKMLNGRMTLIRRTTGPGFEPLETAAIRGRQADFDMVFGILWARQLLDVPVPMTPRWRSLFYFYSHGVPDILVKLFKAVQERALDDGLPSITEELVHTVARDDLRRLTDIGIALGCTEHPGARRFLWEKSDVRPKSVDWDLFASTELKRRRSEVPRWTADEAVKQFIAKQDGKAVSDSVSTGDKKPLADQNQQPTDKPDVRQPADASPTNGAETSKDAPSKGGGKPAGRNRKQTANKSATAPVTPSKPLPSAEPTVWKDPDAE